MRKGLWRGWIAGAFAAAALAVIACPGTARGQVDIRGDANRDGRVTISDASFIIGQLIGGSFTGCASVADADDDGKVSLADAVGILLSSFGRAPTLPPVTGPGCAGGVGGRVTDRDYGMTWAAPESIERGQLEVELFLRARTAGAIDAFSISCWVDTMAVERIRADFEGTPWAFLDADEAELAGLAHLGGQHAGDVTAFAGLEDIGLQIRARRHAADLD